MKIRGDEHVSPKIIAIVGEIALSEGWEFTSVYDSGHGGSTDVHWVTAFAKEGGNAIISADTDFLKLYPQIKAIFDTGMRVIHMPKRWSQAQGRLQTAFILEWWPRIEAQLQSMRPRECYEPRWNMSESGELKKVKIDFQQAEKRHRQAQRNK